MTWVSKHGCAVVVGNIDVMSRSIAVVALDGWESTIHASLEKGREATAMPDYSNPAFFEAGHIPYNKVDAVLLEMQDKLRKAAASQRLPKKSHKTPSFVWAKLLDAMVDLKLMSTEQVNAKLECYQGGTTDVGLHTGCLPRNTSFPLVASVYSKMLCLSNDYDHQRFYKALCVFYLFHLRYVLLCLGFCE